MGRAAPAVGRAAPAAEEAAPAADGPAADRITLRGLRVFGYHGVLAAERRDGQEFIVDAVLWLDTAAAAATDDLALTANYAALADRLAAVMAGPPVQLIETLAQRLAEAATEPQRNRAAGPRSRDHRAQAARTRGPPFRRRVGDHPPPPRRPGRITHDQRPGSG